MKQPSYTFVDYWHIAAPPDTVNRALLAHEDWVHWWKGLERVEVLDGRIGAGARFACRWRSGMGCKLHLIVTIVDYQPGRTVSFTSVGDLMGYGNFALESASDDHTSMIIHWNATPTKQWMHLFAPVLRPLFTYLHGRLMAAGESGLNAYVADRAGR